LPLFLFCGKVSTGDVMKTKKIAGISSILLATMIWGSAFVAQQVGMDHIGPITFQAVRCFLAVIGLLLVITVFDRFSRDGKTSREKWSNKQLWKGGILCGIPLFFACNLQQLGLVDTDPGKSAFLTAMYILFVPIIDLFRGKPCSKLIPVSVLLSCVGLYFLSCVGVTTIALSDLLLLGCAVMFAIQITFVDMFASQVDPLRLNCIQALVCAVLSAVVMAFTEQPTWHGIYEASLPLAYTGFLSMGAAYSLQIIGQKHLPPAASSLLMSLESVFAVLTGWIILGDVLTLWESIGCLLVLVAVVLSQLPTKHK